MRVFPRSTGTPESSAYSQWTTALLLGCFHDQSAAAGLTPITLVGAATGAHLYRPDQTEFAGNAGKAQTAEQIKRNLTNLGLHVSSITMLRPDHHPAYVIVATTDHPHQFLAQHRQPESAVFGPLNAYEGTFLVVENTHGRPILITGQATRIGSGIGYTSPA